MAITYVETASWDTAGTANGSLRWKEVTFSGCAVGDLLVVVGVQEANGGSGTRAVATTAGTTSAWTLSQPAVGTNTDVDVGGGWATVSAAGTVTVRVSLRAGASIVMGVAGWRVPVAEKGATFGWSLANGFTADTDGQTSITLSASSWVAYCAGDFSGGNPGSTTTPAGGAVRQNGFNASTYGRFAADWSTQASGTRNYGPSGLSSRDFSGVVFRMDQAAGGTSVTPANAAHAHAATSPTLTAHAVLAPDSAQHAHTAAAPVLVQHQVLVVDSATHGHAASSPALTPQTGLSPASATHAHVATSPALVQHQALTPANASHGHAASSPSLTQHQVAAPASATHTHVATSPSLVQHHTLAPAAATHSHVATSPTLTVSGTLSPAPGLHAHVATSPTLTQHQVLAVAGGQHSHVATSPTLAARYALAAASTAHQHTASSPVLTQRHVLAVASAWHQHAATSPVLANPDAPDTPDVIPLVGAGPVRLTGTTRPHPVRSTDRPITLEGT